LVRKPGLGSESALKGDRTDVCRRAARSGIERSHRRLAMGAAIEAFKIEVSDETLADLKRRLAATRFPQQIPGKTTSTGAPRRRNSIAFRSSPR
jgi:hypothetical protein